MKIKEIKKLRLLLARLQFEYGDNENMCDFEIIDDIIDDIIKNNKII